MGDNRNKIQSDNTRVVQKPIVLPIKHRLKPDEVLLTDRNTGEKILVKTPNVTIVPDRRSDYQRQQSQNKAQQLYKQREEEREQKERMEALQGFFTFTLPSTYIGPVFNSNGKPYLDNVLSGEGSGSADVNLAIDLLTPFGPKGISKGYNLASRELKYLFPKTKLYSDNSIINAYATLARRYNLPDKARLPYLIRRVKSKDLDFTDDGMVILNGSRFGHTNFTYDRIVVPHNKGKWDAAEQTLLINPRDLVRNNKFGSIEPSDMFTIQDPAEGLSVPPKDVINITANPTATRQSAQHQIQTFSNSALKTQELAQLLSEHQAYLQNFGKRFQFTKDARNLSNRDYWDAVFDIQKKFGRPKVKDIRLLEQVTGLKSGIQDIKDLPIFRNLTQEEIINNLPRFGNNRVFKGNNSGITYPYKNFFYDPSTPAESKFVFPPNDL